MRRDEIARAAGLTIDSLLAAKRELGLPRLRRAGRRIAEPDPTPQEIATACQEIRRGWTPQEHAVRAGYRPLETYETETARRHKIIPISGIVAAWEH